MQHGENGKRVKALHTNLTFPLSSWMDLNLLTSLHGKRQQKRFALRMWHSGEGYEMLSTDAPSSECRLALSPFLSVPVTHRVSRR